MKTTRSNNRRNFLLAAGLGGVGVVTAATGAKPVAKAVKQVESHSTETKYRDSEHIRKYYETTKV
jgi:hypothetical protein